MSCVLRASGDHFDVDSFLAESNFEPCAVYHKGEQKHSSKKDDLSASSGFTLDVSEAGFDDFNQQVQDATRFISENHIELVRLKSYLGIKSISLDFGVNTNFDAAARSLRFPQELIQKVAALNIGLEISLYAVSDDEE